DKPVDSFCIALTTPCSTREVYGFAEIISAAVICCCAARQARMERALLDILYNDSCARPVAPAQPFMTRRHCGWFTWKHGIFNSTCSTIATR
ncbi:MAG TPA: hypothetical protein VN046_11275, partial [Stenotrophobium sp.]|nr:hypothetical protein [Stenotrophobium sp.]